MYIRYNYKKLMSQSKKQSLIEAITNTAVGFGISLLSIFIIFPVLGIHSTPGKNVAITLYFTVISIARSYVLRRFFNRKRSTPIFKRETWSAHCFECEIEMPVNTFEDGQHYCVNCGLRHFKNDVFKN